MTIPPDSGKLPRKYVFLDRDGVINVERGDYTVTIDQWEWAEGALEGIKLLTDAGFGVIVITNQGCIAKGTQTEEGLSVLHDYMIQGVNEAGGKILSVYHCPHLSSDGCSCNKPNPGMMLKAAEDYSIDLASTFMVGDSLRDMEAGRRAGTKTLLITSGPGSDSQRTQFDAGEFSATTTLEAARIILKETEPDS